MMVAEEPLRPSEVAARLDVAANTLRVYSARFASLLSSAAARPAPGRSGRPGRRLYTAQDVTVLKRARDLVAQGLTYEQALAQLRSSMPSTEAAQSQSEVRVGPPDLVAHLATLQQAVDAWRSLAEERAREAADLRRRFDAVQAELCEERRRRLAVEELIRLAAAEPKGGESARPPVQASWLARLFSREPGEGAGSAG